MIRILTLSFLFLISLPVFAQDNSGLFGFFSWISSLGEDLYNAAAVDAPSAIQRFYATAIEWFAVIWINAQIEAVKFAWGVAKVILEDLAFGSTLNALMSSLPNDVQAFLGVIRFADCVEILVGAHVTRFVMGII